MRRELKKIWLKNSSYVILYKQLFIIKISFYFVKMTQETSDFILKLIDMMTIYEDIIGWNQEQDEVIIKDFQKIKQEVLPKYFRHTKFQSFVRQLNMYNFHKVCRQKNNFIHFKNQIFFKGNQSNFSKIRRKKKNQSRIKLPELLEQNIQYIRENLQIPEKVKQLIILLLNFKNISVQQSKRASQLISNLSDEIKVSKLKKIQPNISQIKSSYQELDAKSEEIQNILKSMKTNKQTERKQPLLRLKPLSEPLQQNLNACIDNTINRNSLLESAKYKKFDFQCRASFRIHSFRSITSFIQIHKEQDHKRNSDNKSQFSIQLNHQQQNYLQ